MMINPVLAEWETEVRASHNRQLAEQLHLQRIAESAKQPSSGEQAGFSVAHLRGTRSLGLARVSSLAKTARKAVVAWLSNPPLVEEECAEA